MDACTEEIIPSQSDFKDESLEQDAPIETKEASENNYNRQKLKTIVRLCDQYSTFLTLLLGRTPEKNDNITLNKMWGQFNHESQEMQIPDAVIKFPNPDYKGAKHHCISAIEAFDIIQELVKYESGNLERKILLKACEGVIAQLDDSDNHTKKTSQHRYFRQKVKRENQFVEFENTEETKRYETSTMLAEEEYNLKLKNKLIIQLNNKLTGSQQLDFDLNRANEAFLIDFQLLKQLPEKKMFRGNYLVKIEKQYERSKLDTKDFSTLIRNLIMLILSKQGYFSSLFISKNGKYIFCSLFATEESLKQQAQHSGLQKLLNIQFVDLFSFEPLDHSYRPLRLNNRLWRPQNYKITLMFDYLRPMLVRLIKEIDFKRIAREINQSGINQKLFHYGFDQYDDQEGPSDQEWVAFFFYLTHLNKELKGIRQNYQINSDIAALINQQITPQYLIERREKRKVAINMNNLTDTGLQRVKQQKIDQLILEMNNTINEYRNIFNLNTVPYTKLIKVLKKEQQAKQYLNLFKESLKVANQDKSHLKCLWDLLNLEQPVSMKSQYSNPQKDRSTHHQHCQLMCWKKYQLNQGEKVTIFQSSERLRLAYLNMFQTFPMNLLKEKGLISQFFCLHDNFELFGLYYQSYENLSKHRDQFYQEKLFDVASQLKFNIFHPMRMKFSLFCQYFGEFVGSYFYFLCYFCEMLLVQTILGAIYYIVSLIETNIQTVSMIQLIYIILQLQVTSFYSAKWQRQLKIFSFSHSVNSQEDVSTTTSRSIGEPKRSLVDDQMNVIHINEVDYILRQGISIVIFVLLQVLCSALFVALYFLCVWFRSLLSVSKNVGSVEVIIVASLHILLNKLYTQYSTQAILYLVDFENQRTIQSVKSSLNLKLYSFSIIQQLGPLLIFRFFNESLDLICSGDLCNQYIGYYFLTYISFKSIEKLGIFLYNFYSLRTQSLFVYKFQQQDIDEYIQLQSKKPSNIKSQYYNKIEENIQQNMVELTILSYFAFIYPISYLFQWLLFIVQIYADKAQYLYYYQRPWPEIDCFDQVWNNILTFITFSSIIISSFGLSNLPQFDNSNQTLVYVTTMILSFTLNFLYEIWYSETPSILQQLIGRQTYLVKSTLENFKKKRKTVALSDISNLKRMLIYKIFGTTPYNQDGEFETLSSENDLEQHYVNHQELVTSPILQDVSPEPKMQQSSTIFQQRMKKKMLIRSSSFFIQFVNQQNIKKIDHKRVKLFKKADLLILHKKAWLDLRFQQRYYYIRRKKQIINNFEQKRYDIIRKSLNNQKEYALDYITNLQRKKLSKLKDSKEEHDIKELQIIQEKIRKYVHKHKWLNSRKFVVFKVKKAVWFNSYRRSILKLSSKILLEAIQKQISSIKTLQRDETNFEQFEKNYKNLDIQEISLSSLVNYSSQFNTNYVKFIPLTAGHTNLKFYSAAHKKSFIFTSIIEKVRDTYIFDTQRTLLQQITMEYFYEELFPIPEITFIKQLNDTSWLATIDDRKELQMIQFLQLKHGKKLTFLSEMNEDRGVGYIQGQHYVRLSNLIDKIDDFYVKGYCVIIYNRAPISTLEGVIKFRKKFGLHYTQDELLSFLYDNLLLLLREQHGDISIRNYVLENGSYYLGNSIRNDDECDLKCLAKVLISMITLSLDKDWQHLLNDLYKHDLFDLLNKMIEGKINISEILSKIKYQDRFKETFIVQKLENVKENQQCDFQEYLQITLHRANFSLRMKQLEKGLIYIHQLEIILHRQVYKSGNNAAEAFQNYIINNFMKYTINSADMEEIIQISMIFFIKFSIDVQIRKKSQSNQMNMITECLHDLIKNLDLILIQLQLNINIEQMTKQEANALFGVHQSQSGNIIRLKHYERIRLINILRQNQKYIENIFSFRKTIRRFQNQIQVIKSLTHYFKLEMPIASKIIDDCIEVQMELIRSKNKLEITKELKDLNPDLYNYDQVSPKENKIDAFTFQINSSMNQLCEEDPAYFHQLLFYYYLQIIIWHDTDDNDQYQQKIRSFLYMDISSSPTYLYFSYQLKGLIEDEIPFKYIEMELRCEVGKFQIVQLQKWLEQTYGYQSQLIPSSDICFMWKQIMTYSNLQQSLNNKQILHDQLKTDPNDLKSQLLIIRIVHQILHLDCYFPLSYPFSQLRYSLDPQDKEVIQHSYISQLQMLHNEISVPTESWFHANGMLQFRVYHILSIFFAFSPKHIENQERLETSLKDLGKNAIYTMRLQKDNRDTLMKTQQILLEDEFLLIDINIKPHQIYQMIYSYLLLKQSKFLSIQTTFQEIQNIITNKISSSIFILMLLQILLQAQKYEQMEFIISFSKKLLSIKATIFSHCHDNFENDLNIMELHISNRVTNLKFIEPYDLLFTRSPTVRYFEDINVYTRYLIHHCFFHQNFLEVIEYLEDNLNQIGNNLELLKLKELSTHFLIYLKISIGLIKQEKVQDYIVLILQKFTIEHETLIDAITKHFLIKIYVNLKEYELALPYSNQVLQYFYKYENSKFIELKGNFQSKHSKQQTNFQELLSMFVKQDDIGSVKMQQESDDVYYFHLIDSEFICEILLTHIEILCNLGIFNASIFQILHLLDRTSNNYQIAYLYKLLAMIFQQNIAFDKYQIKFDKNTVEQAKQIVRERKLLIKSYQAFRHQHTTQDIILYNQQLGKLTFQQIVYQKYSRKPQVDEILFLIQVSTEKSLQFFTQLSEQERFGNHFFFIQLHIMLADTYLQLQNFTVAFQNLDYAEEHAIEIYGKNHHPQVGYFLLQRSLFRKKQQKMQIAMLKDLQSLNFFDIGQLKTIALLLLQENKNMTLYLDYYRKNNNIQIFYKNSKDLIKINQNFCESFLLSDEGSTVEDICQEILRLFPSLNHSQLQNYLNASHHLIYLDERNQYRLLINQILRNQV